MILNVVALVLIAASAVLGGGTPEVLSTASTSPLRPLFDPAVVSWGENRLDIISSSSGASAANPPGHFHRFWVSGTGWSPTWVRIDGTTNPPSCVSATEGTVDCFWLVSMGKAGFVVRRWSYDQATAAWTNRGNVPDVDGRVSRFRCVSHVVGSIACFMTLSNAGGPVRRRIWSNGAWSAWTAIGTGLQGVECAVVAGDITCFAHDTNARVHRLEHAQSAGQGALWAALPTMTMNGNFKLRVWSQAGSIRLVAVPTAFGSTETVEGARVATRDANGQWSWGPLVQKRRNECVVERTLSNGKTAVHTVYSTPSPSTMQQWVQIV